jgi:hypothetical protein
MAEEQAAVEVKQEGDFKIKKKPKKFVEQVTNEPIKVDITKDPNVKVEDPIKVEIKKEDNAVQAQEADDSNAIVEEQKDSANSQEVVEEVRSSDKELETPIQEITEDELDEKTTELFEKAEEAVKEQVKQGKPLPENIESLVNFMNETGGTMEDYVRLNYDYSKIDDQSLLRDYYKSTKPHLNQEEINFLLEDKFKYDEEIDEPRDIRKKKLAFKEEVANARKDLAKFKDQYYQEIKLRPGITQEQQKASEFFNRYNEQQELANQQAESFKNQTEQLFTDDFKGFDFNLGEKKFRYKLQNPKQTGNTQTDINNFISKFLNKDGGVADPVGYHKALYAAMNADKIANHFYEQGKADGVKNVIDSSKNLTTDKPRQVADGNVFVDGLKVKAISGVDSSKLKIKKRKFN